MKQWIVEFTPKAAKDFRKLDKVVKDAITQFMKRLVRDYPHPRIPGKPLSNEYKGIWRYRVGDYRLMCELFDDRHTVEVLGISHRSEVYTRKFH